MLILRVSYLKNELNLEVKSLMKTQIDNTVAAKI